MAPISNTEHTLVVHLNTFLPTHSQTPIPSKNYFPKGRAKSDIKETTNHPPNDTMRGNAKYGNMRGLDRESRTRIFGLEKVLRCAGACNEIPPLAPSQYSEYT